MKTCLTALAFFGSILWSSGQEVRRLQDESVESFVERIKPDSSVTTHRVIATNWDLKQVIIAFYDQAYKATSGDLGEDEHRILAMLFVQGKQNQYEKILIDTIPTEGGPPEIDSVFFANADKDLEQELIVLASWRVRHYDVNGTLYSTFIYDNIFATGDKKLRVLENISERLSGGCECDWRDGKHKKAKFKTASSIQKGLKRLGY